MDRSFIGRCHPDNLWALCGLAGCLKMKLQKFEADAEESHKIAEELKEVSGKIELLRVKSDVEVNVSCLCVTKRTLV